MRTQTRALSPPGRPSAPASPVPQAPFQHQPRHTRAPGGRPQHAPHLPIGRRALWPGARRSPPVMPSQHPLPSPHPTRPTPRAPAFHATSQPATLLPQHHGLLQGGPELLPADPRETFPSCKLDPVTSPLLTSGSTADLGHRWGPRLLPSPPQSLHPRGPAFRQTTFPSGPDNPQDGLPPSLRL